MTKKTEQKQLDELFREITEGLEDMQDYHYIADEYQAKARTILYKLRNYRWKYKV